MTVLAAFAVSLAVELLQWTGIAGARLPSLTDLLANSTGAAVGWQTPTVLSIFLSIRGQRAASLTRFWGLLLLAVFWLTALGIQPVRFPPHEAVTKTRPSKFDYSPGYGYYGGRISALTHNGEVVRHAGYGPAVREATAFGEFQQLTIQLRGLDNADNVRVIAFVHPAGDSIPLLLVAQHENRVELRRRSRAEAFGLSPQVLGHNAGLTDRSASLLIDIVSSSDRLEVRTVGEQGPSHSHVALTPLLGWSLLQSIVAIGSPAATALQTCWVAGLFVPLGWLARRAAPARKLTIGRGTIMWAAAIVGVLILLPQVTGVHELRFIDWVQVASMFVAGVLLAAVPIDSRMAPRATA